MRAFEISRSGMEVEWRRLEVIAQNLANASTSLTATGEPYRAMRLISGPRTDFSAQVNRSGAQDGLGGVAVYGMEPTSAPPRRVHEPTNPQADADGYVSYPAIDHAAEMALMVKTARAYEANIVAVNPARQMYAKAMELGKR